MFNPELTGAFVRPLHYQTERRDESRKKKKQTEKKQTLNHLNINDK